MTGIKRLETVNLCRKFETPMGNISVLEGLSFSAYAGEMTAILGESGSGKTTLLQILGLLEAPTSGRYMLNGQDTGAFGEQKRAFLRNRLLGFVFQQFRLIPSWTAEENVAYPLMLAGVGGKERQKRVCAALEEVGLLHRAHYLPGALSGGQQQRVALARALILHPKVILADEPTGNLDPASAVQMTELLLRQRNAGCCVLLITHSPAVAACADRVFRLENGCLSAAKGQHFSV